MDREDAKRKLTKPLEILGRYKYVLLVVALGAALLAEGVLNLCVALSTVKIVKNQRPDVIETEYFEVREYR